MDTAVIDEGTFDQEGLIIEADEVVGETAIIKIDLWKRQATEGTFPARYVCAVVGTVIMSKPQSGLRRLVSHHPV